MEATEFLSWRLPDLMDLYGALQTLEVPAPVDLVAAIEAKGGLPERARKFRWEDSASCAVRDLAEAHGWNPEDLAEGYDFEPVEMTAPAQVPAIPAADTPAPKKPRAKAKPAADKFPLAAATLPATKS